MVKGFLFVTHRREVIDCFEKGDMSVFCADEIAL